MNSAMAFNYAISGAMGEQQIQQYANYVSASYDQVKSMGGWLAEQADKTMTEFKNFVDSRAWELSSRLSRRNEGEYVGRFQIGYLGSVNGLQNAEGFMRNYIMAHPGLMQDYIDEEISGYNGEFNSHCVGIGRENIFYRRAMNGIVHFEEVNEQKRAVHTHYHDIDNGTMSFREREQVQQTWRAIDHHRLNTLFDVTSVEGNKRKSHCDTEEQE